MPITLYCHNCKRYGQPPRGVENINIEGDEFLSPWDKELAERERRANNVPVPQPSDGNCNECGKPMAVLEG